MKALIKNPISSILFFLIFCCFSCKSYHPLSKYNYNNGATFYNDSIPIMVEYFGDNVIKKLDVRDFRNFRKSIKGLRTLRLDDLLVSTDGWDPEYRTLLFYKTLKNKTDAKTDTIELIFSDSIQNKILYKKTKGFSSAFLLIERLNENTGFQNLILEGIDLVNKITFNVDDARRLTYSKIFNTYRGNPNYLIVRDKLKNAPITKSDHNEWMKFQFLATIHSFISNNPEYDSIIRKYQQKQKQYFKPIIDSLRKATNTIKNDSVYSAISEASKHSKVVMLNEMHWLPNHRLVAQKLLKPLKEKGFKYLAVEAINKTQDSLLNKTGIPKRNMGYYVQEPYFGNFIREAKKLDYTIVGYDDFGANREEAQAMNIKKILDKDADAKIFVYAGIDHILEYNPSKKRMAEYLKEITEIDPVTIDQVQVLIDSENELELIKSSKLKNIKKVNSNVDFFLINGINLNFESLLGNNNVRTVSIKDAFSKHLNEDLLASVYYKHEYEKYKRRTVPIYNRIIKIEDDITTLDIPKNSNIVIEIRDTEDSQVLLKKIEKE